MNVTKKQLIKLENTSLGIKFDESTDVEGRFIAYVIVRTLLVDKLGDIHLSTSEILDKVNFSTIA